MERDYIVCPECRAQLEPERIRCSRCSAFVYDTNPWRKDHNIVLIPVAMVLTVLAVLFINFLPESFLNTVFGDGISMAILGVGIYSILLVLMKAQVTRIQQRAFRIIREQCAESETINDDTLARIRERIVAERLGSYNTLLAYNRIQWVVQAAKSPRDRRKSQLSGLREHGTTDWDAQESAFAPIQYLVWLLPSMGFLGTVYGMTRALSKFSYAVSRQASELAFKEALGGTAKGLGAAFHTTLVGLAAVIPVLWLATGTRRRSQQFLEQLDKFFVRLSMDALELPEPEEPDVKSEEDAEQRPESEAPTEIFARKTEAEPEEQCDTQEDVAAAASFEVPNLDRLREELDDKGVQADDSPPAEVGRPDAIPESVNDPTRQEDHADVQEVKTTE